MLRKFMWKSHQAKEIQSTDLHFFNTESRQKERFTPISQSRPVRMYTCGPTVYDYAHIGNLRSFVFADITKRTLEYNGYKVEHTINLTDFGHLTDDGDEGEDKIMQGLKKAKLPFTLNNMRDFSDTYISAFKKDIDKLRIKPPNHWARASDYVKEQIRLIKTLEEKGYVYETSDGLYFDIQKFPTYGRLGKIDLNSLKHNARVEENPEKHHPADFAVWKKGVLGWESPWDKGFPGWHIECSAMAIATLGRRIDLHTGGIDHIHTHHNAEIAQSEAATGKTFVKYWLHNEFVTIDNTKISKSLGNTITLRHLEDRGFPGDEYRYWLLTAHYRSPINFSFDALTASKQALYRLKRHLIEDFTGEKGLPDPDTLVRFKNALNDDLDTPQAISLLWEVVKNTKLSPGEKRATIQKMDEVLAIGLRDSDNETAHSLGVVSEDDVPTEVQKLLNERKRARQEKNWEKADLLREEINLQGYAVEDTADGMRITKS